MKTTLITAIGAALATTCTAAAIDSGLTKITRSEDGVLPHPLGLMGTVITIDGEEKLLQGWDLDDIEAKAQAEYGVSIFRNETVDESVPESTRLAKRESQNCGVSRWGLVSHIGISQGQQHLHRVDRCIVQARQCIRTTCNGGDAIAWCNDNTYAINIPCSTVANMAFNAQWGCQQDQASLPYPNLRSTQRFHGSERWNVILADCGLFSPGGQPVKM